MKFRQREHKAFKSVMIFAELTASCLRHAELAQPPNSATQSKLQLNRCCKAPHSFISYYAYFPVQGSLCDKGKRVQANHLGLLPVTLKQTKLCQHGWEGSAFEASPAASHSSLRCGWLQAGSQPNEQHRQIFADLWSHSNTPDDPPNFSGNFRSDWLWGPLFF